jgi:hypothetical protein
VKDDDAGSRHRRQVQALCEALGGPLREDLVGASWWYEDLARQGDRLLRTRRLARFTAVAACLPLASGCAELSAAAQGDHPGDALEVQRLHGWSVGQESRPLDFPGAVDHDIDGTTRWREATDGLATRLEPAQAALQPFYVPTLFQALSSPAGQGLRAELVPIVTPAMARAFERGLGLRSLLEAGGFPRDVALVIDLPGPEAVAVAAALADRFDPVFTFDNWPHPAGVVPSHLTLAAALYYLPLLERGRAQRPSPAPVAFVLDSLRLSPYADESWSFDNRYMARLPGADELRRVGIDHLLYVTGGGRPPQELDDLNDDFVALERSGVDVRMLSLDDFQELAPGAVWTDRPGPQVPTYLGGQPGYHLHFWSWTGWGPRRVCPPPPRGIAPYCRYHPQPRPTMFHALHGGAWVRAPHAFAGFGQVPAATSSWRSGSLGRFRGSSSS